VFAPRGRTRATAAYLRRSMTAVAGRLRSCLGCLPRAPAGVRAGILRRHARRWLGGPGRGGPLWGVSVTVCMPPDASSLAAALPSRSPAPVWVARPRRARGGSRCDRKSAVRVKKQLRIPRAEGLADASSIPTASTIPKRPEDSPAFFAYRKTPIVTGVCAWPSRRHPPADPRFRPCLASDLS
jgi:hypothetical protein